MKTKHHSWQELSFLDRSFNPAGFFKLSWNHEITCHQSHPATTKRNRSWCGKKSRWHRVESMSIFRRQNQLQLVEVFFFSSSSPVMNDWNVSHRCLTILIALCACNHLGIFLRGWIELDEMWNEIKHLFLQRFDFQLCDSKHWSNIWIIESAAHKSNIFSGWRRTLRKISNSKLFLSLRSLAAF